MIPILRSSMQSWTRSSLLARNATLPQGEPLVTVPGIDPDRVLVVGSGPAAGPGAVDHAVALPGCLARALAARTGRGATVEARGEHGALLQDVPAMVARASLGRFDAVVVFTGLEDGTAGTPVRRWRRGLAELVDLLRAEGARDAAVVLARIPPASSIGTYRGALVALADLRIRRMNRAADRLVRQQEGLVRISVPRPDDAAPAGSTAWYERCGEALAALLHDRFGAADR